MARRRRQTPSGGSTPGRDPAAEIRAFLTAPTAPDRDTRPVDRLTGSYRVVSLYRYLRCDSHRVGDPCEKVDLLRAMHFNALHGGQSCDDALICHDWTAVGEPVVLPCWRIAEHNSWVDEIDHIPWMKSDALWFEVTPDDVVVPAYRPSWAGPEWEDSPA